MGPSTPRDVDGAGHDSDVLAIPVRADVDAQGAVLRRRERLGGRKTVEPGPRVVKQLVEGANHGWMISVRSSEALPR